MLGQRGNELKLKKEEIKQIVECVQSEVLADQIEEIEKEIEDQKQKTEEESEEERPEMSSFLQAIDLMEEKSKIIDEQELDQTN